MVKFNPLLTKAKEIGLIQDDAAPVMVPESFWCGHYRDDSKNIILDGSTCCFLHKIGLPRRFGKRHQLYSWQTDFLSELNTKKRKFFILKPPKVGATYLLLYWALHQALTNPTWQNGQVAIVVGTTGLNEAPKWNTIRVRESTYREIEKALNHNEVKKEGISSITQFVTNAITKHLKELQRVGFKSVTIEGKIITIFDENIGSGVIVYVHIGKNKLECQECNSSDCPHVNYIWSIEHIAEKLEIKYDLMRNEKTCPKCGTIAIQSQIEELFGYRKNIDKIITQSYCKKCRSNKK